MQQRFTTILWVVILSAGLISGKTTSAAPAEDTHYSAMRKTQIQPWASIPADEPDQLNALLNYAWELAPQVTSSKLNDLTLLTGSDGWAVGANGTILHWNGSDWQGFPSPTTKSLNAIALLNATDGWAVGNGGEILHWDGVTWQQVPAGITGVDLLAVSIISPTMGWAAGEYGKIYRWDGVAWTLAASPAVRTLNDIAMLSETEGWMAGVDGTLLHWNGSEWQSLASLTNNALTGLSALNPLEVWASAGTGFLRWDGTQWSKLATNYSGLEDVSIVSSWDGWAVGESGLLVHWDGLEWLQASSPVTYTLNAVDMLDGSNGWAVGLNGTLLHYASQAPQLLINYPAGRPGSFFSLSGVRFPAGSQAVVSVNDQALGTVTVSSQGELDFLLDTQLAGPGRYIVTASSPGAQPGSASFQLDLAAELRPQEGSGLIFQVPAGTAFEKALFLAAVYR